MELNEKISSLVDYRSALHEEDQMIFDRLMNYAKDHVVPCVKANKLTILESMLLGILIEQQKVIEKIEN
ncbi:MAG: hypothetical protein ACP5N9_02860 [Candidatus Bilamarchaeum sp.]